MDLQLADKVYVVTGGSRGLGLATARALVADGARVVVSARREATLQQAVARLGPDRATAVAAAPLPATEQPSPFSFNGIIRDGQEPVELTAGSTAVFPLGWRGEWDVTQTLRKVFTIYRP